MTRNIIGTVIDLDGQHHYRELSADEVLKMQKDLITAGEILERLFNYLPDEYLPGIHAATESLLQVEDWMHRSVTPIEWQKAVRNDPDNILRRSLEQMDLPF